MPDQPAAGEGQSKNAKRRANKKAAAAAGEVAAAPPPAPEPAPKAKAKAKAKAQAEPEPPAPAPKAKAKAKAQAQPAQAEPAPKSKAKAKAQPKAAAAPEPEPPKAEEPAKKSKNKAKSAAKPVKKVEDEPPAVEEPPKQDLVNWTIDDGQGGDWEAVSGMTKKQQKRKENAEKAEQDARNSGMLHNLPANQARIPGMGAGDMANHAANLKGISQAAQADVSRILGAKGEAAPAEEKDKVSSTTVVVPEKQIGIVIGPRGAKIKAIQEKTGVTRIDTQCDPWVISGDPAKILVAKQAIEELATKGYCPLLYENFAENMVSVHPSVFPDLIGKEGVVIRKIKEDLGVEVTIPKVPPSAPPSKKFKVTLAGSSESVEKAKNCINDIVMYGHSELTHPGVTHQEMEVDAWAYRYIIGTKGSELRHIQKNYHVKVSIPREHSANQNVLVVGEPRDVERAKAYIENSLWKAENAATQGRDRVDASDVWGDEEEEEEWMKAYLYKR